MVFDKKVKLNGVGEIEDYFKDCGKEYYENDVDFLDSIEHVAIKIQDDYFLVEIEAELESEKRDKGDRLYSVESITSISYSPITFDELKEVLNRGTMAKITELKAEIQALADTLIK